MSALLCFSTCPDAATADTLAALGVTRWVFSQPAARADTILPRLDRLAEGIARLG